MTNDTKYIEEDSIDLRTIFHLFLKRKWWFIGSFIIVLVLGMMYVISKPVIYEVRYKFSFEDDFLPDDYLQYSDSQELYTNESVFIEVQDISLIFKTDFIFRSLEDIEEIGDDYSDYMSSSRQDLDLEDDTSIFTLKIKNEDKQLADNIARSLIESLNTRVMNNDLEIFNNTLNMLRDDIAVFEEENSSYNNKITDIEKEIQDMYLMLDGSSDDTVLLISDGLHYDIIEKKGEVLIYRERIIDNEYEIEKLEALSQIFSEEKSKVHSRVEILTEDPGVGVENNRTMNSIIVVLLSLLTGIIAVLIVNYIYKLNRK